MTNREHEELLTAATDRFERRLAEESGKLRSEVGQLRVDMVTQGSETRMEVARLRLDMTAEFAESRLQSEARHRELLKWALGFWLTLSATTAAIVSAWNALQR